MKITFYNLFLLIMLLSLVFVFVFTVKSAIKIKELDYKQSVFQESNSPYIFNYSCDGDIYQEAWYNCADAFRNLTGHYCITNGTYVLVCQNSYTQKDKTK